MSVFRFRRRIVLMVCIAAGCQPAAKQQRSVVRDDFGNAVALDRPPSRIVSLNPTTTEILFAIGAGSRLVGRSQYDVFPDSARLVPDLGRPIRPNVQTPPPAPPGLLNPHSSPDHQPSTE